MRRDRDSLWRFRGVDLARGIEGSAMLIDSRKSSGVGQPLHRRLGRLAVEPPNRSLALIDALSWVIGLVALVEHFRARAAYSSAPLYALIFPVAAFLGSGAYRLRAALAFRRECLRLEAYSVGRGPIPWLGPCSSRSYRPGC